MVDAPGNILEFLPYLLDAVGEIQKHCCIWDVVIKLTKSCGFNPGSAKKYFKTFSSKSKFFTKSINIFVLF
jgi:hypothetical protein